MAITIKPVTETTELYCRYSGQSQPQRAYVEIDYSDGVILCSYNAEIGNAIPFDVHHGHRERWTIPALLPAAANELMADIAPLAERACAGYSSEWDGHNHVAKFSDDAESARDAIGSLVERCNWDAADDDDTANVWDASDWYQCVSVDGIASDLGITAETTDAELDAIIDRERAAAAADGVHEITDLDDYLYSARDNVREKVNA